MTYKDKESRYRFYRFPVQHVYKSKNGIDESRFDLILDTQTNQVLAPLRSIGQMAKTNDRTPSKWLNKLCPGSSVRIQIQVPCSVAPGGWYTFQCYSSTEIAVFLKRYNHPWTQGDNPGQTVNEELLKFINLNVPVSPPLHTHTTPSTLPSTVPSTLAVKPNVEQDVKQLDLLEAVESKGRTNDETVYEPIEFEFHAHKVRLIVLGVKWEIVAPDLVAAIYPRSLRSNYTNHLKLVRNKYLGLKKIKTSAGVRTVTTLTEPGCYEFFAKSQSPDAEPFQEWLYEDVLVSIHKTGSYSVQDSLLRENPPTQAEAILQLINALQETGKALVEHERRLLELERNYVQDRAEREASRKALLALPTSDKEAPEFTDRMKVRSLIASRAGYDNAEYKACWRRLYRQYEMIGKCNLKARMKYSGCSTKLDQIELDGGMETLFAIATELFAIKEA